MADTSRARTAAHSASRIPAATAEHPAQHPGPVPEPLALLGLLDGWMANGGSDADHPWRLAIAQTLGKFNKAAPAAKAPSSALETDAAFFKLHARFLVASGATVVDLVSDACNLLQSAHDVHAACHLSSGEHFAVLHLMAQALALVVLASDLAERQQWAEGRGAA